MRRDESQGLATSKLALESLASACLLPAGGLSASLASDLNRYNDCLEIVDSWGPVWVVAVVYIAID